MPVRIRLSWDDNNVAESGHTIYRSDAPMDPAALPTPLITLAADVAEYLDESVTEGQTYYYRVGAFNGLEELVSAEVFATVSVETPVVVLRRITVFQASVGSYTSPNFGRVRGFHLSPDGTKGLLCGFVSTGDAIAVAPGIESMTLASPGSVLSMTRNHFWQAPSIVLGARIYGTDQKAAIVSLNVPWKVVRYRLENPWSFSGTVTEEAAITDLNGKTAGTFQIGSNGLWGVHYGFDTTWAALFALPTAGAIESAQLQYSVDLASTLSLASGESFTGCFMSDDGTRAWLFVGNYSGNTGRLIQLVLSAPHDLRTATVASTLVTPIYVAAHPPGWHEPNRTLLLCHQASQVVRGYAPATMDW